MSKKITLKQKITFEAFVGDKSLGEYNLESEWNGLAKLKGKRGELIVKREDAAMRTIAAMLTDTPSEEVSVIMGTPDILADVVSA